MKIAIITGASSGMGREFALQMDTAFHNIDEFWLIARNEDRLMELSDNLMHKTRIFPMDLTKKMDLYHFNSILNREKPTVCMLINSAGYGLMGPFMQQDTKETLGMIRLNCEALTAITKMVIPFMKNHSRIIQLASGAAFLPQADFAVYAATKSYVLSFSKALGMELRNRGISVTSVCPGPVDTEFFDRAQKNGSTLAMKKNIMEEPDQVVRKALRDSYYRNTVSICGIPMNLGAIAFKVIPHDILLDICNALKRIEKR